MKSWAKALPRDIHTLATQYHWEESTILRLTHARRRRYLMLIEQDADTALFAGVQSEI